MIVDIVVQFTKGYIAHPYWPARERVITIQTESGMNRSRSEGKARQSLLDYLASKNLTLDEYTALVETASREWYTNGDGSSIVIPAHQIYGCFGQTAAVATSAVRLARPEQIRTVLHTSDWTTDKSQADGVWERFVPVKSGPGGKLSNKRALRSNQYLGPCTASGQLTFSADVLREAKVRSFVEFAGREIGVGASRKLDWGRFAIHAWTVTSDD